MSDDMTSPATERLTITTSDGVELAAEWAIPGDPVAVAVTCHPHPLYGGSMHANVVEALFRSLPGRSTAVLRFDFRGAGGSSGVHDEGRAERLDVEAAVAAASERFAGLPLLLAGYSFGADVSLTVADNRVGAWLAVAPPLRVVAIEQMSALTDPRPVHLLAGAHDQFRPPDEATELVGGHPSVTVEAVPGADHFFAVGLDRIADAAARMVDTLLAG